MALTLLILFDLAKQTTSGNTAQALAVLVQKFILTVAKNTVAVHLIVVQVASATDLQNSGTMFLLSLITMATTTTLRSTIPISIQVWVLKDLLAFCRV